MKILLLILLLFIFISIYLYTLGTCGLSLGWVGTLQTCDCVGYELVIIDEIAHDGDLQSACIGIITSKEKFDPQIPRQF